MYLLLFLVDLLFRMVLVHLVCPEIGQRGENEKREDRSIMETMIKMDSLILLLVQEVLLVLEVPWSPGKRTTKTYLIKMIK